MIEPYCQNATFSTCDNDELSFRAYLNRWMAQTAVLAPFSFDIIMPKLRTTAPAAAQQCGGGANGHMCGSRWINLGVWDGSQGPGQELCALEAIQAHLVPAASAAKTNSTGGTSRGDPNAGMYTYYPGEPLAPIKMADRVGAGILTTLSTLLVVFGLWWMIV
jgi:mannan endo-1,6-alpha-mannosidase